MNIGFIGLGNMGAPMATNLVNANHSLQGFDLVAPMPQGVSAAGNAAEAAADKDVVITMLPNGEILQSVAAEVLPAMRKGSVFIDCSTVDVESAIKVAEQAKAAGLGALDAPVSGGTIGATAGSLTFMIGGDESTLATVETLFDVMGQKAVFCGKPGNGQAAKICNNMIGGAIMVATCEAFVLADKLGLEREKMFDVVSTSSGSSWVLNTYCPAPGVGPETPSDNNYAGGFASELMLKDLRLSQQAAQTVNADTPMGRAATAEFTDFVENEDGRGFDMSKILTRFERRAK